MIREFFRAALAIAVLAAFPILSGTPALAAEKNFSGLDSYALSTAVPAHKQSYGDLLSRSRHQSQAKSGLFAPIKLASRRSRRRNRAIIGGIALGLTALIIAESIRRERARHHYRDDYYYDDDDEYVTNRRCRRWARKCDRGRRWACRKLYRYCEAY